MCLVLADQSEDIEPIEARKDILVFKVAIQTGRSTDTIISSDKRFKYERGGHYYQQPDEKTDENGFEVKKIHSDKGNSISAVFGGLHAYLTEKIAEKKMKIATDCPMKKDQKLVIVRMLIPAGAKYFVNKRDGEIVATEIIYPPKGVRISASTL